MHKDKEVQKEESRCGLVAVIGAPNAGKSTLVNRLVGAKISIVSRKVQTTRRRVIGVALRGATQIVLVDTPGIFTPHKRLERAMVQAAWQAIQQVDALCFLVDLEKMYLQETKEILERLPKTSPFPLFLILNKIDAVPREKLLTVAKDLNDLHPFTKTFMVSALHGQGVEDLEKALIDAMPQGQWLYPEDQLSDLSERLLAAEITREKIYTFLHDELPYATTVETEHWESAKDGGIKIHQIIYVRRPGQKSIILGKQGQMIKRLGEASRKELVGLLGCPVHLFLHVKVKKDWDEDRRHFQEMGLDFDV